MAAFNLGGPSATRIATIGGQGASAAFSPNGVLYMTGSSTVNTTAAVGVVVAQHTPISSGVPVEARTTMGGCD